MTNNNNKMFVPDKIKVGYQKRSDTYTKKLAYVIYFDNKGVLRKEKSWEGWRDKAIEPQEFNNEPTEGFVLNKGVGGARYSYYNARNEYIRVYDPRDFEFEISVANLLFILQECTSTKGKGLEGKFVYSWDGTELVLLPVDSKEYENCVKHTERQSKKVEASDIKPGLSYVMKDGSNVMYIGRYPCSNSIIKNYKYGRPNGKKHVFLNLNDDGKGCYYTYILENGFTNVAEIISSTPLSQFPDELDKFKESEVHFEWLSLEVVPSNKSISDVYRGLIESNGNVKLVNIRYKGYYDYYSNNRKFEISESVEFTPVIKAGKVKIPSESGTYKDISRGEINKLKFVKLIGITTNNKRIEIM